MRHRGGLETTRRTRTRARPEGKAKGFSLVFDVVRRFAQPLGIDLPKWEGRVIETKKGVVRLLAVSERAKQLFGEDGADAAARVDQTTTLGTSHAADALPGVGQRLPRIRRSGRARQGRLQPSTVSNDELRRHPRGHHARPGARGHAASGGRAGQRATGAPQSRAGSRARTSCAWPTPSRPSTPRAARKSACWTPCSWQCRGRCR